ncbi:MAG: DUF421 domain-containing protein [Angelakisella sp.]
MFVSFFRTLILYSVIIFGMRLMGKRQLGELQPTELVITILISNIATLPLENVETPLFLGLLPILTLVTCEVLISLVNLHFRKARRIFSGTPAVVISGGVIDQQKLHQLRYSVDDLVAQLRSQNVYDVGEVDFALVETTGKLSVYQKFLNRPLCPDTLSLPDEPQKNSPPLVIISEGKINQDYLRLAGKTQQWLEQTVASYHLSLDRVYLMTVDLADKVTLIKKDRGGR